MGALIELRSQLRNLQWFGEINRRGFVKITKKLDKKVPNTSTQHRYVSTKVDVRPFAKDTKIARILGEINKWLSVLSDRQNLDDAKSDRSARSLGRASAKGMLTLPQALLDILDQAIRSDDVPALQKGLQEGSLPENDQASHILLLNLLQRSISARSRDSMSFLLTRIKSLHEPDDINERNCIHRLIIHIGRTRVPSPEKEPSAFPFPVGTQFTSQYMQPALAPSTLTRALNQEETNLLSRDDDVVQILVYLLDQLHPHQRPALQTKDAFGRLPLHYAAQFGFVIVCQVIMSKMQEWGQFDVDEGIDAPEWQDKEGYAPLHLSVIGGHPLTTRALLQGEDWQGFHEKKVELRKKVAKSGAVLTLATKANYEVIVEMLVEAGVNVNWRDHTGETALHVAARFGHTGCAEVLLRGTEDLKADVEIAENSYAWTPLHVAAVDGQLSMVQLLVNGGADVLKPDSSGWTAKEHAALRGHLDIARVLAAKMDEKSTPSSPVPRLPKDFQQGLPPTSPDSSSIDGRRSNVASRPAEPVKTFGHRYLTNESMVLVSLGSMDMRKNLDAVKLDRIPLTEAHLTELDTALSIVVSATGAHGEPTIMDLPIHENVATEPIVFTTSELTKVKILFDIVPTYSGNEKNKIGRAVALLSSLKPMIGTKRMNLQGDVCVPIMAANLEVIGTVNFNFLVVTPFSHPKMEVNSQQTYWKKLSSTMVIGHRGLGKNLTSNKSLQLGENTVPSFIAAANLGANYVEFDVQLTKDHVPVVYHDFLVSETGIDAPVHALTLEQFLHINPDAKRGHTDQPFDAVPKVGTNGRANGRPNGYMNGARQRSQSMGFVGESSIELDERMKHTRDFKEKGFKANSRGNFIQAPFATLEDLFRQLPENIGFNIEMKYPMLHESEEHDMDTYAVELNSFCDTVLSKVYDLAESRHIIFSSFNPDICLCLSYKQPSIPVMFLTDAGVAPVGDVRASSLQEAIRFASRWNLIGIVSAAEPLINSPRLVKVVKESGLLCVSYGALNNNPIMVQVSQLRPSISTSSLVEDVSTDGVSQRQVKEGVDAVIVDNVLAIRKGLTDKDAEAESDAVVVETATADIPAIAT